MKFTFAIALFVISFATISFAQVTGTPSTQGGTCTDKAAQLAAGAPNPLSTSNPSVNCTDGSACGYVVTYNPPQTVCVDNDDTCCKGQLQQAYTEGNGCVPKYPGSSETTCKGGGKVFRGPMLLVKITVGCSEGGPGGGGGCAKVKRFTEF